ncbi:hypothetical protein, partial [Candidatus Hakubella thermalkaliphila]
TRARQADIGEAQWEMARQDAMSKWTAAMSWDREKYYTTFKESARRFGIEQEKIDRAFGLDVRRVELAFKSWSCRNCPSLASMEVSQISTHFRRYYGFW